MAAVVTVVALIVGCIVSMKPSLQALPMSLRSRAVVAGRTMSGLGESMAPDIDWPMGERSLSHGTG